MTSPVPYLPASNWAIWPVTLVAHPYPRSYNSRYLETDSQPCYLQPANRSQLTIIN